MMGNTEKQPILELKDISKSFPGVKALDNISLRLRENSVIALVGENGAGKSTLIKIITGVYKPDSGEIRLKGEKVSFEKTQDAFDMGISVVHQERNLCETFSVVENMFLEQITRKAFSTVNMKNYIKKAKKYLDLVGLDVDPEQSVTSLKAGQQQLLEIARALTMESRIIMLDEPTASISITESDMLLERVSNLRSKGYSFIFVSHKLDEVFRIADEIVVIRDGKNTFSAPIEKSTEFRDKVITAMVGRAENKKTYPTRDRTDRSVVMEAIDVCGVSRNKPVSFALHKGEILGWYGLVGAGRTEFARELIGVDKIASGEVHIDGKVIRIRNPKEAINRYGIAYISENRNEEGVYVAHDVTTNISSEVLEQLKGPIGWISRKKEDALTDIFVRDLEIKTPSNKQLVVNLSGGNRQKVSVAKVLAAKPSILIFDEPSVGIDIKTKDEIHDMILKLAEEGISVILISSDMNEMIKVADRIQVFNDAQIVNTLFNTKVYSEMSEKIMHSIVGDTNNIIIKQEEER